MAIQGKITSLYSDRENTEALFPRTKVNAISDDNNIGLDAILRSAAYSDPLDNGEAATIPLDADSLAGIPAKDYATQVYVKNEIANAQLNGGSGEGGEIDLSGFATKDDITNLNNIISNIDFPVDSVNSKTGTVSLSAADIGAAPFNYLQYGTHNGDFNTITEPGWYWTQLGQCTNTPLGQLEGAYGYLEVVAPFGNTNVLQRYTDYPAGKTWVRSSVNGWQPWVRVDGIGFLAKADIRSAFKSVDTNGNVTLNGLTSFPTEAGVYRVTSAVYGLPAGSIGYGTLIIFDGGSYQLHLYRDANGCLYQRRKDDGGTTEWFRLVTSDCFSYSNGTLTITI